MTRKAFVADLAAAREKEIKGVSELVRGEEDGDISFSYTTAANHTISIKVMASDVSSYPSGTQYFLYTDSEHVPKVIDEVLAFLQETCSGVMLVELISQIASEIQQALENGSRLTSCGTKKVLESGTIESDSDDYGYTWSPESPSRGSTSRIHIEGDAAVFINKRIVQDLKITKFAGYKLGIIEGMKAESSVGIISISIQVEKLGLSEEVLQAWDLQRQQYIVLLIRYFGLYKTFGEIISEPASSHRIDFRVGICNRYKPTSTECHAAFLTVSKTVSDIPMPSTSGASSPTRQGLDSGFRNLFISSSLNDFMNEQFISLLKIRHAENISWDQARYIYSQQQGRVRLDSVSLPSDKYTETESTKQLPAYVTSDHFLEADDEFLSFPLIAMQFALRYLVRCTEFCLICHDRTEEKFEAMKPYVCSKPLCLYQYMSLGFGPSIEHEIITQPYVVDLLVSFCYASAKGRRLREYPTGMNLIVPPLTEGFAYSSQLTYKQQISNIGLPINTNETQLQESGDAPGVPVSEGAPDTIIWKVKFDESRKEILFDRQKCTKLRRGDWVVITTLVPTQYGSSSAGTSQSHYRVEDILMPTVRLSKVGVLRKTQWVLATPNTANDDSDIKDSSKPELDPQHNVCIEAEMTIYENNFDLMNPEAKADAIASLLEIMPSVREMQAYLQRDGQTSESSLKTWSSRMPPAVLGILRWIVASNRSVIVQIDNSPGQTDQDAILAGIRLDQKVTNMDGYVQFRFAQGAPDKEHRFNLALEENKSSLNKKHPTLFAWHGSILANWHSIIRTGLDFTETLNGRACGHGVYFSQNLHTSLIYSSRSVSNIWPGSQLKVSTAICLSEVVNLPSQFVHSQECLVVDKVDWIQCRYIFVRQLHSGPFQAQSANAPPTPIIPSRSNTISLIKQDPNFTVRGVNYLEAADIPRNAFPASRGFFTTGFSPSSPKGKRQKLNSPSRDNTSYDTDTDITSDIEDVEDLAFLLSDEEVEDEVVEEEKVAEEVTQFFPGQLDKRNLQILGPPIDATSGATTALAKELKNCLKTQDNTQAKQLGWYIDKDLVSNVYQWIVELHSFPKEIPLAKDMQNARLFSIVLEIRFGKDYPMTPPFVRVIRPRFLSFLAGGGGHVTAGGAMCMELLTNSGWSAAYSIESVLLQVRLALMSDQPSPARLDPTCLLPAPPGFHPYSYRVGEAVEAYIRACRNHGWEVPKNFREFANIGTSEST